MGLRYKKVSPFPIQPRFFSTLQSKAANLANPPVVPLLLLQKSASLTFCLRKAHVTHPELKVTVQLPIISVKKNPQNPMYTQLGVLTKGTVIEVNVSELGMVTAGGKVVWGRWAQITNAPENDGCVNAVLLV